MSKPPGVLWGEMLPATADALIAALGLPCEREESAIEGLSPMRFKQTTIFDVTAVKEESGGKEGKEE
jgi:hypothetical protein